MEKMENQLAWTPNPGTLWYMPQVNRTRRRRVQRLLAHPDTHVVNLARLVGVSPATLYKVRNGERVKPQTYEKIERAFRRGDR